MGKKWTDLQIRRHLRSLKRTEDWLIRGYPITWNIVQDRFRVYFKVREHKITLTFRKYKNKKNDFYYSSKTDTFYGTVILNLFWLDEPKKATIYWQFPEG